MPPRPRNIDDSRSEASSTVANQKEKALLGPTGSSGITKARRTAAANAHGGASGQSSKAAATSAITATTTTTTTTITTAAAAAATSSSTATEKDPSLPKTDWNTVPASILRTYRVAYRLPVPSTLNHPHADLTYKSSRVALRAPSAVQARRKLREQKHQRRNANPSLNAAQTNGMGTSTSTTTGKNSNNNSKSSSKDKDRDRERKEGGNAYATNNNNTNDSTAAAAHDRSSEQASSTLSASTTSSSTFLGRREPASHLANAVRKHFNAQQLSEADTIARFIYVVQQNGRTVRTEGSGGDGTGSWMGSHGRQVRRIDGPGGEVGFRLRFRP
ncbi:hypothetical protein PV08_00352 [Exophiala spinifera]|uniref:Histone deacetylase complex subunit SAP30 Sin3 binding domain-containing protein n=1 Tax=Exophiala spinifera TaxID=91928 RepID=A0A0D2A4L6_9EURO|nr:uncharacterized protein PV08_00352 [Exophiala spinifera]KIW19777.1 hypothetical protein PV08_00352 [Exophiala spinifera]